MLLMGKGCVKTLWTLKKLTVVSFELSESISASDAFAHSPRLYRYYWGLWAWFSFPARLTLSWDWNDFPLDCYMSEKDPNLISNMNLVYISKQNQNKKKKRKQAQTDRYFAIQWKYRAKLVGVIRKLCFHCNGLWIEGIMAWHFVLAYEVLLKI